jgi:fructose-bisphosphate aldolase, class II
MQVSTDLLFSNCYKQYGIAAVNVWSMEEVLAIFSAAQRASAPFIIQTTPAARNYAGETMLLNMIDAASKMYPETIYAIHLDHGTEEHALKAINSGKYSSVMIDGSHLPFDENIKLTTKITQIARARGIMVEAELGVLSGVEDDLVVSENERKYTQPDEVEEFIAKTGCDSLAIAIGTSHGAYKFKGNQGINIELLKEIARRLPAFPLVLHGGSAIESNEIVRINNAGGKLAADASGVKSNEIQSAIKNGICKINIASDLRLLWTRVNREYLMEYPECFDPVIPGRTYMKAVEETLTRKFELFGSTGKADEFLLEN